MTNQELNSEITKLSPKIATLLSGQAGRRIALELGSLAQTFTNTPDLATAVNALKSDPAKVVNI